MVGGWACPLAEIVFVRACPLAGGWGLKLGLRVAGCGLRVAGSGFGFGVGWGVCVCVECEVWGCVVERLGLVDADEEGDADEDWGW